MADPLAAGLPDYDDAFVARELEIFREWYLGRHLGLTLAAGDQALLDEAFAVLRAAALEQPRVWMHRDYHSRNLMVTAHRNPGILDFQDAVRGPLTYDLVSLLRDCYIRWPRERVRAWALDHRARLRELGMTALGADEAQFLRWFDLMG
ncbi:MAG: phosphotransferase, partial [Planctomycetales bacterium]|nr:phosphotransferase [Planctomycetales bacterium]